MSHFRPYPIYVDSGSLWIGDVPAEWRTKRLRHIASFSNSNVDKKSYEDQQSVLLCNYTDVYYNEFIRPGLHFMKATASMKEIEQFTLRSGDIIITKDSEDPRDIGVPALVESDLPGVVCGYHLTLIRASEEVSPRFLHRAIQARPSKAHFNVESPGITRFGLGQDTIGDLAIVFPPVSDQEMISDWVDSQTVRMDTLIEKKTRFIELLKEKRQALITHAVTKGLNPEAPMKDSGVESLGEVPAHWMVVRLKFLTPSITVGIVVDPSKYIANDGLPFIYGGDVSEGRIHHETARSISTDDSNKNNKTKLAPGDLITVRVGAPGVTAVVPPECEGGNCASVVLIRRGDYVSNWLQYVMNSRALRFQVKLVQYGAAQEQFNVGHAVDFVIPVPPIDEQKKLSEALSYECGRIEQLIEKTLRSIDLLLERRSALITAAVTGKIDVRDTA